MQVSLARWFDIDQLVAAWVDAGRPKREFTLPPECCAEGHADKVSVGSNNAKCLEALRQGRFLEGTIKANEKANIVEAHFGAR